MTSIPTVNDMAASGLSITQRFRRISNLMERANDNPEIVQAYGDHVDTCPVCSLNGPNGCAKALEIILPKTEVDWLLSQPLRDTPDVMEMAMANQPTPELQAIIRDCQDNGSTESRYYRTALRILANRAQKPPIQDADWEL